MKIQHVLLCIALTVLGFVCINTYAQQNNLVISETQRLRQEKTALAEWIVQHTKANKQPISGIKARKIVDYVYEYSAIHKTDPLLVLAMMRNESGFRDTAKSPYGAKGLMQVVPRYHREKLSGRDPFDKETSIDVGIQVLKEYLDASNGQLRPALRKYSGQKHDSGLKGYYGKIARTYKELATHLVEHAFIHEYPIAIVYSIDKPVIPVTTAVSVVASN